MTDPQQDSWIVRPSSIRLMSIVSCIILGLTVLLQLIVKVKGYFVVDEWFAFGAIFGFFSCVLMVLVAKVLGFVLKREETYYVDSDDLDQDQDAGKSARNDHD